MSDLRLTRRGRLLVQTFPLFLVAAVGLQAAVSRSQAAPAPAPRRPVVGATTSPTPSPAASPTPSRTPSPTPVRTPSPAFHPTGVLDVVPGGSAVHGSGPLRRFTVEVEAGLPDDPVAFAHAVERVLFDEHGWGGGGRLSFQRVSSGPVSFHVVLASPATTNALCEPLDTDGVYSCFQHGRSVLNALRWHDGAAAYRGDLASYRIYMVNHEVGHALGHGHKHTCGPGGYAYVMIQQTKGLEGCRANPWPLAGER